MSPTSVVTQIPGGHKKPPIQSVFRRFFCVRKKSPISLCREGEEYKTHSWEITPPDLVLVTNLLTPIVVNG